MDELKILIEAVAGLPQLALWVVAAFWAYKVCVIGSIYSVVRFVVGMMHDYLIRQKTQVVEVRATLDGMTIGASVEALVAQLKRAIRATEEAEIRRLPPRAPSSSTATSKYIHNNTIEWLRVAIDDKIEKDRA